MLNRYRHLFTIQNGTIMFAFVIALGWVWGTVQTLQKNFTYQQQVDTLTETIELEKLRNENLKFQQQYYKSAEFLELSARQRLGKASPGEKLIILPDSRNIKDTAQAEADPAAVVAVETSNLSQWIRFFFGDKT